MFSCLYIHILQCVVSVVFLIGSGWDVPAPSLSLCLPFAIPAILYFINNNLAVHMQLQMDPASYQVYMDSCHGFVF